MNVRNSVSVDMKNVQNFLMTQGKSKSERVLTLSELLRKDPNALVTHHPLRLSIKAPLPSPKEVPLMGITSDKDYVVSNAVDVIVAVPRNRGSTSVDYLTKPDYGKIPKYMKKIRKELEHERRLDEQFKREREEATNAKRRLLSMEERHALVDSLKQRLTNVNQQYQQITHMTVLDTLSKVKRKETYEKLLEQIEKDIALIDRPESFEIFVDLES